MSKIAELMKKLNINDEFTKEVRQPKKYTHVKDVVRLTRGLNYQADLLALPITKEGFRYLFVIVDVASKECDIEPLKNKDAENVKAALLKTIKRNLIKTPSAGSYLGTDSGSEFKGAFHNYLYSRGIYHKVGAAGRHSQQAIVESVNKQLGRILNGYMNNKEEETGHTYREWDDIIDEVRTEFNTIMKIPDKVLQKKEFEKPLLFLTKKAKKGYDYDNPKFSVGDEVYYYLDEPTDALGRKQVDKRFRTGDRRWSMQPHKIKEISIYNGDIRYRYILSGRPNVAYTEYQLKLFKKADKAEETKQEEVKEPEDISPNRSSASDLRKANAFSNADDETFIVEKILDKFKLKGTTYYKVKWKNYPVKDATNEPEEELIKDGLKDMIDEFNEKLKNKKTKKK